MPLEHAARPFCSETKSEKGNESRHGWAIPKEKIHHFALFQLGDTFPEYQPPAGLDFGLCWAKSLSAAGNAV